MFKIIYALACGFAAFMVYIAAHAAEQHGSGISLQAAQLAPVCMVMHPAITDPAMRSRADAEYAACLERQAAKEKEKSR